MNLLGFCDITSRFHGIGIFSCFYITCSIFNAVFKFEKNAFPQQVLGLGYLSIQLTKSPESFEKIGGG